VLPVRVWTGEEAGALRRALRLSVRAYADHLGVAVRTVSKWEQLGAGVQPRPDTQAILDTALDRASPAERLRFQALLAETSPRNGALPGPAETDSWDQETWADDLDRAVVLLSRQNFPAATTLLDRWLNRYAADRLSPKGLYLHARSLVLLGDARRDQGALSGPLSAKPCYSKAHAIFTGLDIPRRAAQIELSLAVLTEMSGGLQPAARTYHHLSSDERLSHRDRARALLWVGTALSKDGDHTPAAQAMARAADQFEELSEAEDWGVAQQKLALAHRGLGDLSRAWHYLDLATTTSGVSDTPLQQVRVSTARAHILLSDAATRQEGLSVLDQAALTAGASGLTHQVRSIQAIRQAAT
jgi:transcriptional regulator with XRE-family HTH domain